MFSAWKAFSETANGEPDPNIVFYEAKQVSYTYISHAATFALTCARAQTVVELH